MSATSQRRRWAYGLIRRASSPPPSYGSPAWLALPDGSSAKVAAIVRAAECWARGGDDLEDRLRVQLVAERAAFKQTEDAVYAARRDAHRANWTGRGFRPDLDLPGDLEREWQRWAGEVVS